MIADIKRELKSDKQNERPEQNSEIHPKSELSVEFIQRN